MTRDEQITAAIDAFNALGKTEDVYGKPSPIRARRPILATDCDYEITSFSGVQGMRLPKAEHLIPAWAGIRACELANELMTGKERYVWSDDCGIPSIRAFALYLAQQDATKTVTPDECEDCDGFGRIWNNADPTSGQWVSCDCGEAA